MILVPQFVFAQYHSNCFTLEQDRSMRKETVRITTDNSTEISFKSKSPIYGLSVSGSVTLENNQDCYVRIVLKDNYNYEYLVYECYPLLAEDLMAEFNNTAMETIMLDGIMPQKLIIEVKDAKVKLDSYSFLSSKSSEDRNQKISEGILKEQCQYISDKLNENLERRNMTWRAKVTSVSSKTYEEKKDMFGGFVPELYGFDYYAGGVFVMPGSNDVQNDTINKNPRIIQYVNQWDWRDRHGRNWMTSVKYQGGCNSCWIFAAVGALEAYTNLYYNQIASYTNSNNEQKIEYDLSEQEVMNCIVDNYCGSRGSPAKALNYIKNNGVVNEECFPYVAQNRDCSSYKCSDPAERVFIENFDTIPDNAQEEYIKTKLFRAPLPFSIIRWTHSMVLVGYKTLAVGDIIRTQPSETITITDTLHQELIGKTAWLFKNSWGDNWGEENGYAYVIVNTSNRYYTNSLIGKVTCMQHTDNDIVCEDADGDGYYFWGIGPKPSNCPSWAPDNPDGDDSDINFGPMNEFGHLQQLPCGSTINNITSYTGNQTLSCLLGIVNGGVLTISGITTMNGNGKIRVCKGGTLIIDGGTIQNADLILVPGGTVILRNGGIINMVSGKTFKTPVGAFLKIESGEIN